MSKSNKIILLANCVAVVVCGVIGLYLEQELFQWKSLLFYTAISNLVAIVMCIVMAVKIATNKLNSKVWKIHFVVASMMAFTFGVVLLGAGLFTNNYGQYFWQNGDWALHLVCPVLVIINHLVFSPKHLTISWGIIPMVITTGYGIVMYILNGLALVSGPYFFFDVQTIGVNAGIQYGIIMVMYCVGITLAMYLPKRQKRQYSATKSTQIVQA